MERSIYRYIWRHSKTQQILVLILALVTFPLLYLSLEVPKRIVNDALGTDYVPTEVLGVELGQIEFLFCLCLAYLTLVLVNGVVKMRVNIFKGTIAERMMRRLRYQLIDRVLRFPRPHFRKLSQGELIPIITAEVEPLGGLMGDALAQPVLQSGQMLTILLFLFMQNPWLGLSAVALIPLQGYVIPKLQMQVNLLQREKVKRVRTLSGRLGETVAGVHDIHLSATTDYTRADFSQRLGEILRVRFEIYKKKYFMKFVNNLMNSLTPFFFYAIGGYLVIQGELTLGALVAALSAYKDLISPWKELLAYYNQFMDSSIRYETIIEQFDPDGLMDEAQQSEFPEPLPNLSGAIELNNVSFNEDDVPALRNISMRIEGGSSVAVVGPDDRGRERLAQILSRILAPSSGQMVIGGLPADTLPESVTGTRIAYVGPDSHVFSGTVGDNLLLSLKSRPPQNFELTQDLREDIAEARAAGNSPHPFQANWVDYRSNGFDNKREFEGWLLKLVEAVSAGDFLFERGLDTVIRPADHRELCDRIVQARQQVGAQLERDESLAALVRRFTPGEYNSYASVAENILFGVPVDHRLATENLRHEPYFEEVLDACNLRARFQHIGLKLVDAMLDMFQDLPPGHPFYERYNFIDEDLLPILGDVRARARVDIGKLTAEELSLLTAAPLLLNPERHRLGLIDDDMQAALLQARRYFHDHLPERLQDAVIAFDDDNYLPKATVLTNILVGRIAFSAAGAERKVRAMVQAICHELGMREDISLLLCELPTGIGGSMLTMPGRERVSLIRALIKRPDVIVLNRAMASFPARQRTDVAIQIRKLLPRATLIWVDRYAAEGFTFDQLFEISDGRVRAHGHEVPSMSAAAPGGVEPGAADGELERLSDTALFSALPREALKRIALVSERRVAQPGDVLFTHGERSDGVYMILEGELELVRADVGGERVLARLGPGDTVGELSVICEQPRGATARTVTPSTLMFTTTEHMMALIADYPGIATAMLKGIGKRLMDIIDAPLLS
jgi:putative ABC transport system ATP-binding protein